MKKIKTTLLLLFLGLPFIATAQWSVNLKAGAGYAKEIAKEVDPGGGISFSFFSRPGYSYFGGADVEYFFSKHLGVGSGLTYAYSKSLDNYVYSMFQTKQYWHSETLNLPLSLLWKPGAKGRSILQAGLSAKINLRHHQYENGLLQPFTYRDNPFFLGFHLGYEYSPIERFKVGVLLNEDIGWFLKEVGRDANNGKVFRSFYRHYFTPQITLSYCLFKGK